MRRAVLLARYTGQRQEDVLMMAPEHTEDGGIKVVQQKTGKELWLPLHPDLRGALEGWRGSPYVLTPRSEPYTPERFRAAWTRLMNDTPAGKIRKSGFTFHGLRASSCEKLREAGCDDAEIGSITGMSPTMIRASISVYQSRLVNLAVDRRDLATAHKRAGCAEMTDNQILWLCRYLGCGIRSSGRGELESRHADGINTVFPQPVNAAIEAIAKGSGHRLWLSPQLEQLCRPCGGRGAIPPGAPRALGWR
jgi:hypothetical protein